MQSDSSLSRIAETTREHGFAFLPGAAMRELLSAYGMTDWESFAASWDDLGPDLYMADGGRYRRRRYATFALDHEKTERKRHQPHYQSRDYNTLNGGIERWFEPVADNVGDHPAMQAILRLMQHFTRDMSPPSLQPETWHTEIHQFRIEASENGSGHPTPEGLHQDGVDWVLVLMIRRENIASGDTTIYDLHRQPLGVFTLEQPMDAAFVDDHKVFHGVTPVYPVDPERPAWRDVLVVTLRHQ
ncbi:2OG-Fe dioxygenase family protein [Acetobacter sp. AN02]|uniref:2OG-Fe dioxygenase family protein n=1 Tax=Acetobacter sp. AN02 TaxID=2894186 RepID=UPI002434199E|nr:2OG-Fe dioxygenase family protein [Acetobacter sp. AN02]MDG6093801.1 2OG-Fe dioxygenase family protein [Acetobacter sp. AN02]